MPILPVDKANHVVYGAATFVVVAIATRLLGYHTLAPHAGLVAGVCVALVKEFADAAANNHAEKNGWAKPHSVELLDVVATLSGALLCWAAAMASRA